MKPTAVSSLLMNGADGISDIEHVRSGIARVDGNAARSLAQAPGGASDQGKAARLGASERGQRTSFNDPLLAAWPAP
jgi:hypothetical protein